MCRISNIRQHIKYSQEKYRKTQSIASANKELTVTTINNLKLKCDHLSYLLEVKDLEIEKCKNALKEINATALQGTIKSLENKCNELTVQIKSQEKIIKDYKNALENDEQTITDLENRLSTPSHQYKTSTPKLHPVTARKIGDIISYSSSSSLLKGGNSDIAKYYNASLDSLGFDITRFIKLFKSNFNITLAKRDFESCKTIGDIITIVSSKIQG